MGISDEFKLGKGFSHALGKAETIRGLNPLQAYYKSLGNVGPADVWLSTLPWCDYSNKELLETWATANSGILLKFDKVPLSIIPGTNGASLYYRLNDAYDISTRVYSRDVANNIFSRPWVGQADVPRRDDNQFLFTTTVAADAAPAAAYNIELYKSPHYVLDVQGITYDDADALISESTIGWAYDPYAGIIYFDFDKTNLDDPNCPQNLGWCKYVNEVLTGVYVPISNVNEIEPLLVSFYLYVGPTLSSGFSGISGGGSGSGATGPQGVTGPYGGPAGVTGLMGITGPYGGAPGSTGLIGATGLPGSGTTGLQGVTGPSGPTGIQGTTGLQGVTGLIGCTGLSGSTGLRGITGESGSTGQQGQTGLQGSTGPRGLGSTGLRGVTGPYGGPSGATGIRGVTGPYGGPAGATGLGFKGDQGDTGLVGLRGVTGPYGGPIGSTGIPGISGVTGPSGFGLTGLQGATGTAGIGVTGSQGVTGLQGLGGTGLQGSTGLSGARGVTGPYGGPSGSTGLQGTTGVGGIGATGVAGLGFTGLRGVTGPYGGPSGATGLQGITGPSGGQQGVTGLSGFGTTGLQGVTGPSTGVKYSEGSSLPVSPNPGDVYYLTSEDKMYRFVPDANGWLQILPGCH